MLTGNMGKLRLIRRLGARNAAAVGLYRARARAGLWRRRLPIGAAYRGPLFTAAPQAEPAPDLADAAATLATADALMAGSMTFYSGTPRRTGAPPRWHGAATADAKQPLPHWSSIDEFADLDIKDVWEPSRFTWAPPLAQAFRLTGRNTYLDALNGWTQDWLASNPANAGPNWKCGQETSIRLMHVLLADHLLTDGLGTTPALARFVAEHCGRIHPTLAYAMAQDNNHGTSEAAGLFVGGTWLQRHADGAVRRSARDWSEAGRRWLENRAARLIAPDGSFSQSSVNYHRMMLDTLSFVEFWRRRQGQPPFSPTFRARAGAATRWLLALTDPHSGDAPNLGANDGARLFLASGPFRDHRSSVQTAATLFLGKKPFATGPWDAPLRWLGVTDAPHEPAPRASAIFPDGGYAVIAPASAETWALVRFPRFRFRPSQADGLHFDLWWRGQNWLRDAGTYRYNTDARWLDYFPSTAAHNTVTFDDRDQMPRVGRFLFGEWLWCDGDPAVRSEGNILSWSGGYTDYKGARHRREVEFSDATWRVTDRVSGYDRKAVLRWRLRPGEWSLERGVCRGGGLTLSVACDRTIDRIGLTEGWESRIYAEKSTLPVLEVEVGPGPARFITTISFDY